MEQCTLVPDSVLTDVSHFIGNVLSGEKLSEIASEKRQNVIKRLTVYAPAISNQYLDMNAGANKVSSTGLHTSVKNEYVGADTQPWEEDEYEECPAEMENFKIEHDIIVETQKNIVNVENPPITIEDPAKVQRAASELKNICAKSGPLLRKERRYFLKFSCFWAAIYEGSLYFYSNERASKASCVVDLVGYQARPLPDLTKDAKKRDSCFEIVCPGKKSFQLVARTAKDMQQWVALVAQESSPATPTLPTRRQLPSIPTADSDSDEYDDVAAVGTSHQAKNLVELETEEIYDDIKLINDSDCDSTYDDIGEIYPKRFSDKGLEEKPKIPPNSTKIGVEITKVITPSEPVIDEDLYDDIDVFMNRDQITGEISNDISPQDSANTTKEDRVINENTETELLTKQEIKDEDLYDDVENFSDLMKSSTVMTPVQDAKKEIQDLLKPKATSSQRANAGKEIPKKEINQKVTPNNQTEKKIIKPGTFPKPFFTSPTGQGVGKPTRKNNIQNLIQQMESSLQMK